MLRLKQQKQLLSLSLKSSSDCWPALCTHSTWRPGLLPLPSTLHPSLSCPCPWGADPMYPLPHWTPSHQALLLREAGFSLLPFLPGSGCSWQGCTSALVPVVPPCPLISPGGLPPVAELHPAHPFPNTCLPNCSDSTREEPSASRQHPD